MLSPPPSTSKFGRIRCRELHQLRLHLLTAVVRLLGVGDVKALAAETWLSSQPTDITRQWLKPHMPEDVR